MDAVDGVPEGVRYGESWRSQQVYRCEICHTRTNRWVFGGFPIAGPRLMCPAHRYREHDAIEDRLEELERIEDRLQDGRDIQSDASEDAPRRLIERLEDERSVVEAKVEQLRAVLAEDHSDIGGIEDDVEVIDFYPTTRSGEPKVSWRRLKRVREDPPDFPSDGPDPVVRYSRNHAGRWFRTVEDPASGLKVREDVGRDFEVDWESVKAEEDEMGPGWVHRELLEQGKLWQLEPWLDDG